MQLPPVAAPLIFSCGKSDEQILAGNYLWDLFKEFRLDEIMRQKDDKNFSEALNALARGSLTQDHMNLFRSREVTPEEIPKESIRLFYSRKKVHCYNQIAIERSNLKSELSDLLNFNDIISD